MIKTNNEYRKFFDSQDPDENVILVVRKHAYLLSLPFITVIFIWVMSIVAYYFFSSNDFFDQEIIKVIIVTSISILLLYGVLLSFIGWLLKYLDILILTNKHLVIVRQNGLFNRGVSVLNLSTVQDISVNQVGVLQTFLNFGRLDIQTAGEEKNFVYTGATSPTEVQDAIMDAKELYINSNNSSGDGVSSPVV